MGPFIKRIIYTPSAQQMAPRFYIEQEPVVGQRMVLPQAASHHAIRVLRLAPGDTITLFTGKKGEFSAQIAEHSKHSTTVTINQYLDITRESPLKIELAQAICANEKMDWIVQKAVEMGVTRIQPITTTRSLIRLSSERASKRLLHWQKIIIAACEQCGRNHIPDIQPIQSFNHWLDQKKTCHTDQNTCFILSPTAQARLKAMPEPKADTQLTLAIGPEGGFTPDEEAAAIQAKFTPIQLGQRILRTESAALATIAAMQTLWGDY